MQKKKKKERERGLKELCCRWPKMPNFMLRKKRAAKENPRPALKGKARGGMPCGHRVSGGGGRVSLDFNKKKTSIGTEFLVTGKTPARGKGGSLSTIHIIWVGGVFYYSSRDKQKLLG